MIIIEGMDNTGKTTLMEKVLKKYPHLKPMRMDNAVTATVDEYRKFVWNILILPVEETKDMIFDRFLFSEAIYGPIVRGGIRITAEEMMGALKLLRTHDPLIVYCRRTADEIRRTFDSREQMDGVADHIDELVDSYEDWMVKVPNVLPYDYDDRDCVDFFNRMLEHYITN